MQQVSTACLMRQWSECDLSSDIHFHPRATSRCGENESAMSRSAGYSSVDGAIISIIIFQLASQPSPDGVENTAFGELRLNDRNGFLINSHVCRFSVLPFHKKSFCIISTRELTYRSFITSFSERHHYATFFSFLPASRLT